ncbi:MAG TPA: hypothetical protein VFC78_18235 [Tepidisphaeraceae bacterium]|nr:hypothetical protein [Tepidisphaeraceae bacterium]
MMKRIEIEMLSETSNCPVVRTPGRKFPGVILQGDTLKALFDAAAEVRGLCGEDNEELCAAACELTDRLANFVVIYEQALRENGLELPYPKAISGEPVVLDSQLRRMVAWRSGTETGF